MRFYFGWVLLPTAKDSRPFVGLHRCDRWTLIAPPLILPPEVPEVVPNLVLLIQMVINNLDDSRVYHLC